MKNLLLFIGLLFVADSVSSQILTDTENISRDSLKSYIKTTNCNLPQHINEVITLNPYSIDSSLTMNFLINEDYMKVDNAFCNAFKDYFSYGFFSSINSTMKAVLTLACTSGLSFSIKAIGDFDHHTCVINYSNSELKNLLETPERPIK